VPYPVTVSFGKPLWQPSAHEVRQAILELGSEAIAARKNREDVLDLRFIRSARKNWSRLAMADSSGRELTYGKALAASRLVANWIGKHRRDEEMIGVLLPPSVEARSPTSGLRWPPTSGESELHGRTRIHGGGDRAVPHPHRRDVESFPGESQDRQHRRSGLYRGHPRRGREAGSAFGVAGSSSHAGAPVELAAYSGFVSHGDFFQRQYGKPKGVMLSHHNVLANIDAIAQVFWIGESDRIIGVLPFFHSFGFTVTVWFPIVMGCGVAYHPNPTDGKSIGALVLKYGGTFLLSTPTFCANYVRSARRRSSPRCDS